MPEAVRFVHAADLHLGATFKRVAATDERVATELLGALPRVLTRIVDLCVAEAADFLVLAGDIYDQPEPPLRVRAQLEREVGRLTDAGIPVYAVHGNHDPADVPARDSTFPAGMRVFSAAHTERVEHRGPDGEVLCVLYGRSFPKAAVTEDYAAGFRRSAADPIAVGVLHTNVGGRPGFEDYAPCTVGELAAVGMDYWALGHIHGPGGVGPESRAYYAGSPQGLQPNESGPHGCYVVTVERGAEPMATFRQLAPVTWASANVDVSADRHAEEVRLRVLETARALAASAGSPVSARMTLTGHTVAHAELAVPGALTDMLDAIHDDTVVEDGWVWVDRLANETLPPIDLEAFRAESGFAGELARAGDRLAGDCAAASAEVQRLLDEAQAAFAERPGIEADPARLVELARDRVLERLVGDGEP